MSGRSRPLGLLTITAVLAGTAVAATASSPAARPAPGFERGPSQHVQVTAADGITLDGWVTSPVVPTGARTPTVLIVTPYLDVAGISTTTIAGNPSTEPEPDCEPTRGTALEGGCGYWSESKMTGGTYTNSLGFPPVRLVRHGYTVAVFSVRGTGSSGGCVEYGGRDEQRDQVDLVTWIARQPWSDGRVAMGGISYSSLTAWEAAVQAPPALKAVVTAGDFVDGYQLVHSPQGTVIPGVSAVLADWDLEYGHTGGDLSGKPGFAQHASCPSQALSTQVAKDLQAGDRDGAYWEQRNLAVRLPAVRAAVLDTAGYWDIGHQYEADAVWGSLRAGTPKAQYKGWWGHLWPDAQNAKTTFDLPTGTTTWEKVVLDWLDYWVRGVGPRPATGTVFHQDHEAVWHESSDWPVRPEGKEVLYLAGSALATAPRAGATSFRSVPPADLTWVANSDSSPVDPGKQGNESSLCQDPLAAQQARVYLSQPVASPTVLAGNPFAYLDLSSSEAGGIVTATLYDLPPGFACQAGGYYDGASWLSSGSADLNFHTTPFTRTAFPIDTPTHVRIDLSDTTATLATGHRVALVLSHGTVAAHGGTTSYPTITVLGGGKEASQIVLPIASGTLGGSAPSLRYPRRPFVPSTYRD